MASYKGRFRPTNPKKYKGDPTQIVYRSRWEARFMLYLDSNPAVVEWSSEEQIVRYRDPFNVKKIRRYFPDFIVVRKAPDGTKYTTMIEVKPHAQTMPPKKALNSRGRPLKAQLTFIKNQAKWKAAKEYCDRKGWSFEVVTEKNVSRLWESNIRFV